MRALAVIALLCGVAVADSGSGSGSGSARKKVIIDIPADVIAPQVSASASPSVARLGSAITLFITAKRPAGTEVNLAEPIELGGGFEVVKKLSVEDKDLADGTKVREWQISIIPWELGDIQVPELGVTFVQNGKAGQVATNPVPVRVLGMLGDADDPKQMRGLAPPKTIIGPDYRLIYAMAIGAAVLAVGIAFWRFRKKRRTHEEALVAGSGMIARRLDMTSERALEQLLAIEQRGDLDREDDRKAGYVSMFEVVREYLGNRYRVATLDLTTSELVKKLGNFDAGASIEAWLEGCDLVRYGGWQATQREAKTALGDARQLVISTTKPTSERSSAAAPKGAAVGSEQV